jgi:hypothetical protein
MKTIKYILLSLVLVLGITSCEKDGDLIYLSSAEGGQLSASDNNIVLAKDKNKTIVLSLAWTKVNLKVSDANMYAPNVLTTTLQASTSSDFTTVKEFTESNQSQAFTGLVLNKLAKDLKATYDVAAPIYFRLKVSEGSNTDPVYSNTTAVNITPYLMDMTVGTILDKDKNATGETLYSPNADGIYKGFIGATGWMNYYMEEGDGTIWGNLPQDGTAFQMSDADDNWNYWYPGFSGCYYTINDVNSKAWSALYLPSLSMTGDVSGDMTYFRAENKWMYVFKATAAGNANINISGTGKQYNYSTSTDDASAIDTPVGFGGTASAVTFGSTASSISVNIPAAGTCTVVLDLGNSKAWTCTIETGDVTPKEINRHLYLSGVNESGWDFSNYLTIYDEATLGYESVLKVKSEWGYKFYQTDGDWSSKLCLGSGNALSGTLTTEGDNNVPGPDEGMYLFKVSLQDMTYSLTPVTGVYYTGFNDDWGTTEMTATETAGVYTATVTVSKVSSYGGQILINADWNLKYGGKDGALTFTAPTNITDDATLGAGTYTLTVDLSKGTYTLK